MVLGFVFVKHAFPKVFLSAKKKKRKKIPKIYFNSPALRRVMYCAYSGQQRELYVYLLTVWQTMCVCVCVRGKREGKRGSALSAGVSQLSTWQNAKRRVNHSPCFIDI